MNGVGNIGRAGATRAVGPAVRIFGKTGPVPGHEPFDTVRR